MLPDYTLLLPLHQPILTRLENQAKQNKLNASYLFIGEKGIGKTQMLYHWIQKLYCKSNIACNQCSHCLLLAKQEHPNFKVIKPATKQILISQIREIIALTSVTPLLPVQRVIVLQNAHLMNLEAANAFLKLLEEPPQNTSIILFTPKEGLLLETIESRCQKIFFPPLSKEILTNLFKKDEQLTQTEINFLLDYAQGKYNEQIIENIDALIVMRDNIYSMLLTLSDKKTNSFVLQPFLLELESIIKKDFVSFFLSFLIAWLHDFIKYKQGVKSFFTNQTVDKKLLAAWQPSIETTQSAFHLVIETESLLNRQATKQLALESLLLTLFSYFHQKS